MRFLILLALICSAAVGARPFGGMALPLIWFGATLPALPLTTPVVPTFSLPSPASTNHGAYYYPTTASTLATDLAAASQAGSGDVIVLPHATPITITSSLTLLNNSAGTGWIYVIPDTLDPTSGQYNPSMLPAAGTRIAPSNTSYMATIYFNVADGVGITSNSSAHHYRFVGVNLDATGSSAQVYYGIYLAHNDTSTSTLDHDIILDRSIIHGDATYGDRHGFDMDGERIIAIDSYIYNCFDYTNSTDAQAIYFGNSDGPYLINDNYLSGSVECIEVGGITLTITNVIPSDITVTNNYLYRTTGQTDSKNLLEFKVAQRALINYNHFEQMYETADQHGHTINFSNIDQSAGSNSWVVVQDITVTNNNFNNVTGGVLVNGTNADGGAPTGARYLIRNNRFYINDSSGDDNGSSVFFFQIENNAGSVIVDHNTLVRGAAWTTMESWAFLVNGTSPNAVFSDNIIDTAAATFAGTSTSGWAGTTAAFLSNPANTSNAFYSSTGYPTGNYYPASEAAIDFTNLSGGVFSLTGASPYHAVGVSGAGLPYTSAGTSDGDGSWSEYDAGGAVKKLLSLLLLTLCALSAAPAFAAYAFVQAVRNPSSGNTISWSPTAGNLCVLWIVTSVGGGSPTVTSVVDNNSVSWTQGLATTALGGGTWYATAYYKPNVESSVTGLTVTFNNGTPGTAALVGVEYSGIATTSPLIGTPVASYQVTPGTGTNAISAGPLNVTSQPALVLGIMGDTVGDYTMTAGTGYTMRANVEPAGDAIHAWIEDLRATTTGNQTVTGTTPGASDSFVSMILSFAEPGAGGTCTHSGKTSGGALTVPTAGSTVVALKSGALGTVDCSATLYPQPTVGNFGAN